MRGFAPSPLEAFGVVVSQQKGLQMLVKLGRRLVVTATLYGRLFQGPVEALDPAVGSGMGGFGKAVLKAVLVEDMPSRVHLAGYIAELHPIIRQHFMYFVGG